MGRGITDAPQEGPAAPTGVATPVADEPPGISPTLIPPPSPQTIGSAPPNMPPTSLCHHDHRTNFTVSLRPPTRDLEGGRGHTGLGGNRNAADRRGQPPLPRLICLCKHDSELIFRRLKLHKFTRKMEQIVIVHGVYMQKHICPASNNIDLN